MPPPKPFWVFNSLYFPWRQVRHYLPQEVLVTLPQIPLLTTEETVPAQRPQGTSPMSCPLSLSFLPPHAFRLLFGINEPRGLPSLPEKKRKKQDPNEIDQRVDWEIENVPEARRGSWRAARREWKWKGPSWEANDHKWPCRVHAQPKLLRFAVHCWLRNKSMTSIGAGQQQTVR